MWLFRAYITRSATGDQQEVEVAFFSSLYSSSPEPIVYPLLSRHDFLSFTSLFLTWRPSVARGEGTEGSAEVELKVSMHDVRIFSFGDITKQETGNREATTRNRKRRLLSSGAPW